METHDSNMGGIGTIELKESFADKCRGMEKVIMAQLTVIDPDKASSTYLARMLKAYQALVELNKHH